MKICNICENEEHYKDGNIRVYNSYWCELITIKIKFCPLCGKNLQHELGKQEDLERVEDAKT